MRRVDELRLPGFDPADPELKGRRRHRRTSLLLESGHWLARSPGAVVVLDHEAAEFFLRSRSAVFPGESPTVTGVLRETIDGSLLRLEGEAHRRLRSLAGPSLSPRAVNRWRPEIREILGDLWEELPGERFDFVSVIARPVPVLVFARMTGISPAEAPRIHDWAQSVRQQPDPVALADPGTVETMQRRTAEFRDWIGPLIEARREEPGDDLVSSLLRTEEEGERLSDREIGNLVLDLLGGAVEPTRAQLAHGIRLFADAPDEWAALRADPEGLIPGAVSEILRFEPAVPFITRKLVEDIEYRDVLFPAGTVLVICTFTGNRDPAAFEEPFEFDPRLARTGARPLTFGAGIHHCIGAGLVRAELEETLGFLAARVERFELTDDPEFQPDGGIYGLDRMEIRVFRPRSG